MIPITPGAGLGAVVKIITAIIDGSKSVLGVDEKNRDINFSIWYTA